MIKTVDYDGTVLRIKFVMDNRKAFYDLLELVKVNLVGRVWNMDLKVWTAPATRSNLRYLQDFGFNFTPAAMQLLAPPEEKKEVVIDESRLQGLFSYQKEGVRFLEGRSGVGIIADEMGLGKTVQAIGYLKLNEDRLPALIVCPATVKGVWVDESLKWLGIKKSDVYVFSSRTVVKLKRERKFYIINYDILKDWENALQEISFRTIVGDEIQYVSSDKAMRTKAFVRVAKEIPHKIFLSGTPIKNYPSEFFTVLNLVAPILFPNRWRYLHQFCDPKYNGFGWTFKGATNQEELREAVAPVMIRREKVEVLKDLPPKLKSVVPLECSPVEMETYLDASEKFKQWVRNNIAKRGLEAQNQVERLKQLAYLAKRNSVLRWIRDFLSTGQKLVVFGIHLNVLDDVEREFRDHCVRIDGSTPSEERQKRINKFQYDPSTKLFVGQIVAAGVGITLTAASSVALLELPWTNADIDQAADRCHRIGQTQCVNVYYLVADGTVENNIIKLLDRKKEVITKIVDGRDAREEDLLGTLLENCLKDGETVCESEGD
jgi:SWI/SNF-related matrix-associated actin-dependent regulator 1 of chromatin subfamily A